MKSTKTITINVRCTPKIKEEISQKAKNAEAEQNYTIYKSKIRTLVEGQLKYLDELE